MQEMVEIVPDEWRSITQPGQKGICYIDDDGGGDITDERIAIAHSTNGTPNIPAERGRRVFKRSANGQSEPIDPDSKDDVFYARAERGSYGFLCVDVS